MFLERYCTNWCSAGYEESFYREISWVFFYVVFYHRFSLFPVCSPFPVMYSHIIFFSLPIYVPVLFSFFTLFYILFALSFVSFFLLQ